MRNKNLKDMTKGKSTKRTLIVLIVLLAILAVIFYFFMINHNTEPTDIIQTAINFSTEDKYQIALKKINELIKLYQSNIFSSSQFLSLKSFISLPLEIGLIGKANPFALPPSPAELLQAGQVAR
jgi:uncharacterized protein YpmS